MKKLFGVLAFLMLVYIIGSAGALDQNTVSLGRGILQMFAGMIVFALLCWLAGGFGYMKEVKKAESPTIDGQKDRHRDYREV